MNPARRAVLATDCATALAVITVLLATSLPAAEPLDTTELRALLAEDRPDALVGLQVAVVVDGKVSEFAFGRRFVHPTDRSRDLPMTVDSLVRAASASKPIAAIAVMQLAERGVLELDADVSRDLGFQLRNPRFPDVPITLRQLLSHTSSIVDGPGYSLPLGERLETLFMPGAHWDDGARFSAHAPGSHFEYSNLGWGVIGTVLERVTHTRFDRLVAKRVLARAGIEGTFDVASLDAGQRARLAVTYRKGAEDAPVWDPAGPWLAQNDDPRSAAAGGSGRWSAVGAAAGIGSYRPGDNGTLFSPQGGLRISSGQLARLWLCLLSDRRRETTGGAACPGAPLLRPATRQQMLAAHWTDDPARDDDGDTLGGQFLSWGLGVQRFTGHHDAAAIVGDSPSARLDGRALVGHLAEAYGLFGGVWFTADGRLGVVYFANGSATPLRAAPGTRSSAYRWEEVIVDWAAREAWRW